MLDFAALDVALGLIFVYPVLALVCSALNETISSVFSWRASYLREGVANLLDPENHSQGQELVKQIYAHPVVNALIRPVSPKGKVRYPAYLPARVFPPHCWTSTPRERSAPSRKRSKPFERAGARRR